MALPPVTNSTQPVPAVGRVFSVILLLTSIAVLATCLTRRLQSVYSWARLPITSWLLIAIYLDSFAFVFLTAVLTKGFDMDAILGICRGTILLCLVFYMTTKVLIYLFLVEKAYIVRGRVRPRFKDRLYLFNCFGMICPYIGVFILNFIFRFAYIDANGVCIMGMKRVAMIPLLSFEVLVNVYLTSLFLVPLRKLYSYKHNMNDTLRTVTLRTFIGSCVTLTSSVANITVLMVLEGEPGWVCMMCCNSDILFSVLILHWVTSVDSTRSSSKSRPSAINDRPYDGTNAGTRASYSRYTKRDNLNGSWAVTSQQEAKNEKRQTAITTLIMANGDAESPKRNMPTDKITVTTERMTQVEIKDESNSEPGTDSIETLEKFGLGEEAS